MKLKILSILLLTSILLNIFDIVLHVAINQPEILRITANVLIITCSIIGLLKYQIGLVLVVGLVFYLILNVLFITLSGIGSAGLVFISLTALLTILSLTLHKIR